jgi:hypothetical protein
MTQAEHIAKSVLKGYTDMGQDFETAKKNAIYALRLITNALYSGAYDPNVQQMFYAIGYLESLRYLHPR